MNASHAVLVVATLGLVGGILLAVSNGRTGTDAVATSRPSSPAALIVAPIAALAVFALSGWVIPSLVVGAVAAVVATHVTRGRATSAGGVDQVEALASWVENVRDVLQAGNQPIGAIGATTETAPVVIRSEVRALFARLSAGQSPETVFRRFADDLDDPLADLVAVGLLIAVTRGAETEAVLTTLATQARHQADRRRIVEAERAPMHREVLLVTLIMCSLFAAVFVFARSSYLNAYDRTTGQLFLAAVLGLYGALLLWVLRLARFPRPARFLTMRVDAP
jgi:Flp pilus assembly protein TadB